MILLLYTNTFIFFLNFFVLFYFYLFYLFLLQLIYNVLSISTVQQSDPVMHIYTLYFSHYPPSCSITNDYIQLPVLHSRMPLPIHSKSNSFHILIPESQSIHLPPTPRGKHKSVPHDHDLFLFHRQVILGIFQTPHISNIMPLFCPSYERIVFHCIYVLYLLNPFICHWAFKLFPCLGYCE